MFNRDQRLTGKQKEQFIVRFVAERKIETYPDDGAEILAENQEEWDPAQKVGVQLERSIRAIYARLWSGCAGVAKEPPSARMVATDLLDSMDGDEFCLLRQMPLPKLSVERVLGHVESLGFAFAPAVSIAVARVAAMALLNDATRRGKAK